MEAAAQNVANLTTPGYKTQKLDSELFSEAGTLAPRTELQLRSDQSIGRLSRSGNKLDLAIAGDGYLLFAGGSGPLLSRGGQLHLGSDGRVLNSQGMALQASGGGDVIIPHDQVAIRPDGTVLDGDKPVARIALVKPEREEAMMPFGGSLFSAAGQALDEANAPNLQQGFLEASNVSLAEQMVSMMEASRSAEGGARLVQVYDELMGKAVNTFAQGGR